jgi:hypothetical protein
MSATEAVVDHQDVLGAWKALPFGRAFIDWMGGSLRGAVRIVGHALVAGAFFFCLQRFVLSQSIDTSVIWSVAGGGGAALLAWLQLRRGG